MLVAGRARGRRPQIQNRGTLGGNIANASPAGDSLPVLAVRRGRGARALDARARAMPFTAFYTRLPRRRVERPTS